MHQNEFLYMFAVVGAGWAVTYGMRALPFLLFSGRDRPLPPWVERFGNLVSPVIIAALVVYSYTGLAWRTPWPYIAGALTVAIQLWRGNPLASIVAGTALYMCLLACGCQTDSQTLSYDGTHPLIRFTARGIKFQDEYVSPAEAVERLKKNKVPTSDTIHVLVDPEYTDRHGLWVFQYNYLGSAGYRRVLFVNERKATSGVMRGSRRFGR